MPFSPGQSGNPRGKKAGTKCKRTIARDAALAKAIAAGQSPLEFLLSVMRDPRADLDMRIDAAKGAAPYVHKKQPQDVNVSGELPAQVIIITPLSKL